MPFKKGESGNPNGRKKGTPNKVTIAAKDAIHQAFDELGGVQSLVDWAKKDDDNRKVFYTQVWSKIVPLQVGGDPDSPLLHEIRQTIVRA